MSIRELNDKELDEVNGEGAYQVLLAGGAICTVGALVAGAFPAMAAAAVAYKTAAALFGAGATFLAFMEGGN